jgi:hypothetical protein
MMLGSIYMGTSVLTTTGTGAVSKTDFSSALSQSDDWSVWCAMSATQIGGSTFFEHVHNSMSAAFFPDSITEESESESKPSKKPTASHLLLLVSCLAYSSTQKLEETCFSEILGFL